MRLRQRKSLRPRHGLRPSVTTGRSDWTPRESADAGQVADEVIAHLAGLQGADVRLTLEIEANIPDGAPEQVVRTVTENSRTLHFDDSGFETE